MIPEIERGSGDSSRTETLDLGPVIP